MHLEKRPTFKKRDEKQQCYKLDKMEDAALALQQTTPAAEKANGLRYDFHYNLRVGNSICDRI